MRLAALLSTGKDSILALHEAIAQGHEIVCAITIKSHNPHSFMFHTPNTNLAQLQADSLGIPLITAETKGEKETELEDLKRAMNLAKERFHIEGIVSGAIKSKYQWNRIDKIAADLEIMALAPLWDTPEEELLKEILKNSINAIITAIAAEGLTEKYLGRPINKDCISDLIALSKKTGIHCAGEGGEYESLCLDAPLFKNKIIINASHIEMENECTGIFRITKAHLEKK